MTTRRQILVPVGELLVSADPAVTLFTCVGSCVAVILYDAREKIAGMVHIVLPGCRNTLRPDDRNAFYADSGVPLLIKEIEQHGASRSQMTAVITGGACLAPDGNPSIGRNNTQKALSLLEGAGIPISRQVTGGSDGRTIEVFVKTGETYIRTSSSSFRSDQTPKRAEEFLPESLLADLADSLEHLRPDPRVSKKLFEVIHQTNIDWQAASDLVHQDIILAMHLFQKCNSPYYGSPQKITSFEAALTRLGPDKLRRICVVTAAGRHHDILQADTGIDQRSLSDHCLGSAVIAQYVAKATCADLQKEAFTAALFHATGHIAVKGVTAQDSSGPNAGSNNGCASFMENDAARYQSHLTSALLAKWSFPQMIVEASFARKLSEHPNTISLAAVVNISCCISTMLGITGTDEKMDPKLSLCAVEQIRNSEYHERMIPNIIQKLRAKGLLC